MRQFLKLIILSSLLSSLCMPLWAQPQAGNPKVERSLTRDISSDPTHYGDYKCEFPDGQVLTFTTDERHIFLMVNGTIIPNASVKIVDSYSLVPLRIISEELGMNVQWEKKDHLVTIKKEGTSVEVITGKTKARVNGKVIDLEIPATIFNGTVYVPAKFVAEAFSLSRGYAPYNSESIEPISRVLENPIIFLDEKPDKEVLSKQQALTIAKKEVTEGYNAFLEEYPDFKEANRLYRTLQNMEENIEKMSVQGKSSRYWIINGPGFILVDEYTGKVFVASIGRRNFIRSINENVSETFLFLYNQEGDNS